MDKAVKLGESWKNADKEKTVGLKKVSSNESTKRGRKLAVLDTLGRLQRDSGGEFILFSRFPNKKKYSSSVDAVGTNAKMFIASEVGKRVEKIWHDEADKAQRERNKSDLMTPAADSSNDFSNNPVVAAQENSEENSEENSDSTAKSSQADPVGDARATAESAQLPMADIDRPLQTETSGQIATPARTITLPIPQKQDSLMKISHGTGPLSPLPPELIAQKELRVSQKNCQITYLKRSTPLNPAKDPTLQTEHAKQLISQNQNTQVRLTKVSTVPRGAKVTKIILPNMNK